jgi:hypothetical protein
MESAASAAIAAAASSSGGGYGDGDGDATMQEHIRTYLNLVQQTSAIADHETAAAMERVMGTIHERERKEQARRQALLEQDMTSQLSAQPQPSSITDTTASVQLLQPRTKARLSVTMPEGGFRSAVPTAGSSSQSVASSSSALLAPEGVRVRAPSPGHAVAARARAAQAATRQAQHNAAADDASGTPLASLRAVFVEGSGLRVANPDGDVTAALLAAKLLGLGGPHQNGR